MTVHAPNQCRDRQQKTRCHFARRVGSLLTGSLLLGALLSPAWSATLEVVASQPETLPGEMVDISIEIAGLGDFAAPSLGTFDLMLTYDPAIFDLEPGTAAVDLFLGDEMFGEAIVTISPGAGTIEILELSLLAIADLTALQPASFPLFSATFTSVGTGDGTFDLVVSQLGDKGGAPIPVNGVTPVVVSAGTILSIPTLGTWALGLLTLLLLSIGVVRIGRLS